MRTLAHAAALVALYASAALAQPDHRIVPGERIGAVRIGMHADDLFGALGQANRLTYMSGQAGGMVQINNILLTYRAHGPMHVNLFRAPRSAELEHVTDVATEDTSHVTDQGVRVGSPTAAVTRAYGPEYEESADALHNTQGIIIRYRRLGLYFGVRDGLVVRIGVSRPQ